MKTRVIIKDRKFVPQVKSHRWSFWTEIAKGSLRASLGMRNEFDTMEEAIADLKQFEDQLVDDGKVVWEGTSTYDVT